MIAFKNSGHFAYGTLLLVDSLPTDHLDCKSFRLWDWTPCHVLHQLLLPV